MYAPSIIVLSHGAAILVSLVAAITDSRTGRIPNWLTIGAAALGVGLHGIFVGTRASGMSLLGLVLAVTVPFFLYRASNGRAIGGGDVKLFAALGALLGPIEGIEAEFGAFVILSVMGLIQLAFRGQLLRVLANSAGLLLNPFLPLARRRVIEPQSMTEMRMGPAIAASVLATTLVEHLHRVLPWLG